MTVSKEMTIGEVVSKYPQTIRVFMQQGLFCVGCAASRFENIEQGALAHNIDVDALIKALNEVVAQPAAAQPVAA